MSSPEPASARVAPLDREAMLCRARALVANLEPLLAALATDLPPDDTARLEVADLIEGLYWSFEWALRRTVRQALAATYYSQRIDQVDRTTKRGRG